MAGAESLEVVMEDERHPLDWYPGEEMPTAVAEMLAADQSSMQSHPAAALLPMMSENDLADLADDIRKHGQRVPITLLDGKILDGRNRWRACEMAGVEPHTVDWDDEGGSPVLWVLSVNVKRRHLTESQRAMIAAEMLPLLEAEGRAKQMAAGAQFHRGNPKETAKVVADLPQPLPSVTDSAPAVDVPAPVAVTTRPPEPKTARAPLSRDKAATAVGVSSRSVADAKVVAEKAPELAERVRDGSMSLGAAAHKVRSEAKQAKQAAQVKEAPQVDVRIERGDATNLPLEANTVDVIFTSPPYGLEKPYHGQNDLSKGWESFMADWLGEAFRVARSPGRLIVNVPLDTTRGGYRPTWPQLCAAALEVGWQYRTAILWDKMNSTKGGIPLGSEDSANAPHPIAEVEVLGLFYKGAWKLEDDRPSDISHEEFGVLKNGLWRLPGESRGWEGHPAPFPEELARRVLVYLSRVGDTVLDPFSGSGTTALTAWKMKRIPIAFDLSAEYVASARRRIAREQERTKRESATPKQPGLDLLAS